MHYLIASGLVIATFLLGTLLPFVLTSGRWTSYRQQSGRVLMRSFVASEIGLRIARAAMWLWVIGVVAYLGEDIGGFDAVMGGIMFVGVTMFLGGLAGVVVGPASLFRIALRGIGRFGGMKETFVFRFIRRIALMYVVGLVAWIGGMIWLIGSRI